MSSVSRLLAKLGIGIARWLARVSGRVEILEAILITPIAAGIAAMQARRGPQRLPQVYRVWDMFGISPVPHHYYQPAYDPRKLPGQTWDTPDPMYGIDLRVDVQLELLRHLSFIDELAPVPIKSPKDELGFFYDNMTFASGDAEILFGMIRHFKPRTMIEIGSGYSTRLARMALGKNRAEGHPARQYLLNNLGPGRAKTGRAGGVGRGEAAVAA